MSCLLRFALLVFALSVALSAGCAPRITPQPDGSSTKPNEAPKLQPTSPGSLVGGRCEYADYRGTATLVCVEKTAESSAQAKLSGSAGYEGYEVHFTFKSDQPLSDEQARKAQENEHLFQLANSWYVGAEYLAKYKLVQGAQLPCTMRVITKGTCTPLLFVFEGIDQTDYFESK